MTKHIVQRRNEKTKKKYETELQTEDRIISYQRSSEHICEYFFSPFHPFFLSKQMSLKRFPRDTNTHTHTRNTKHKTKHYGIMILHGVQTRENTDRTISSCAGTLFIVHFQASCLWQVGWGFSCKRAHTHTHLTCRPFILWPPFTSPSPLHLNVALVWLPRRPCSFSPVAV